MTELRKWGDEHQYDAEPQQGDPDLGVTPKVTLLWMTPDPLGVLAAFSNIYSGKVTRSLNEVTDEERRKALEDVQHTHLQAPLEAIKLHFLIEGVDRAFTHQLVRQRTAVYAQESMRFAVLGDLLDSTTLPPSLDGTKRTDPGVDYTLEPDAQRWRAVWDRVLTMIDRGYHQLVESGMPAEEARGLLPHATATRLHYITDLRNLKDHAGNRLCTQAQFHWRQVFSQIVNEVRNYPKRMVGEGSGWQYEELADSGLFRPVCYQLGHCPFQASFDRSCSIRDRVQQHAHHGTPSSEWNDGDQFEPRLIIKPEEWLLNPSAARKVTS